MVSLKQRPKGMVYKPKEKNIIKLKLFLQKLKSNEN